jgi:hypothetical protein
MHVKNGLKICLHAIQCETGEEDVSGCGEQFKFAINKCLGRCGGGGC